MIYESWKALIAEFIGTGWLVLGGCGSALIASSYPVLGIGFVGVALAFGLSFFTLATAFVHISGAHFNPAVTVGLWAGGRFPIVKVLPYITAQVLGGVGGAVILFFMAHGFAGFVVTQGFVSNGYGLLSPGHFALSSVLLTETVLTFGLVIVVMGVTDRENPTLLAPLSIGLCLTLIHLISIPVDNTSVNPARSTATALFAGGEYLSQLPIFWLAPIAGGLLGGILYRFIFDKRTTII